MISSIAHRGLSGYYKDNSLKSISEAIKLNVDMIEFDVRLCNTGDLVIYHDARSMGDLIHLSSLDYLQQKYNIISLNELFELYGNSKNKPKLLFDIKTSPLKEQQIKLVNMIQNEISKGRINYDDIICSSFNTEILQEIYKLESLIPLGFITTYIDPHLNLMPDVPIKTVSLYYQEITEEIINKLHDSGYKVYGYTINELDDIVQYIDIGIDGIISDFPDKILSMN